MNLSLRDRQVPQSDLLQLGAREDDLDETDIAAYSATVRDDADSYKTLSQE